MGNVVVWKPADSQVYSAQVIMEVFKAAGLPDGVINMVTCDGPVAGDVVFNHPDFAGLHFTGSTGVFRHLWTAVGQNIAKYKATHALLEKQVAKILFWPIPPQVWTKSLPDLSEVLLSFRVRSAVQHLALTYPRPWPAIEEKLIAQVGELKMGSPEDFGNFITAVIDERSWDKINGYLEHVKSDDAVRVLAGGHADKSTGYFVEPTVVVHHRSKIKNNGRGNFWASPDDLRIRGQVTLSWPWTWWIPPVSMP